jgi:hypothetical protein
MDGRLERMEKKASSIDIIQILSRYLAEGTPAVSGEVLLNASIQRHRYRTSSV